MIAEVADIKQLGRCPCGPLRCTYCLGKVVANKCAGLPHDVNRCPHCGYPLRSHKIGDSNADQRTRTR